MEQVRRIGLGLLLALAWWPLGVAAQGEPQLDAANAFVTRWKGEPGKAIEVPLYGKYACRWEEADGTVVRRGVVDGGVLLTMRTGHLPRGTYWLRLYAADGERVLGVVRE